MKPSTLFKITHVLNRATAFFIQPIIMVTNIIMLIAGFVILLIFHNIDIAELAQQTTMLPEAAVWILRMLRSLGWVMMTNILCRLIVILHTLTKESANGYAYDTVWQRACEERHDDGSIAFTSMIHKTETEKYNTLIQYDSNGHVSMLEQSRFPNPERKELPHTYLDRVLFKDGYVHAIHTFDQHGNFIAERMIKRLDVDHTVNTNLTDTERLSNEPATLPQSPQS